MLKKEVNKRGTLENRASFLFPLSWNVGPSGTLTIGHYSNITSVISLKFILNYLFLLFPPAYFFLNKMSVVIPSAWPSNKWASSSPVPDLTFLRVFSLEKLSVWILYLPIRDRQKSFLKKPHTSYKPRNDFLTGLEDISLKCHHQERWHPYLPFFIGRLAAYLLQQKITEKKPPCKLRK